MMSGSVVTYSDNTAAAQACAAAPIAKGERAQAGARNSRDTTATEQRRAKLHACYRVMITLTFAIVVAAALAGAFVYFGVFRADPNANTPNVRGGTPDVATAPAPPAPETLGRTGVVEPDANERGVAPLAWPVLGSLPTRAACVDLREFSTENQKRVLDRVGAAQKLGVAVAVADTKTCHGALVARRPSPGTEHGVPSAANQASGRRALSNMLDVTGPALSFDPTRFEPSAVTTVPAQYVWAKNLATLSHFLVMITFVDEAYFDGKCRHEYTDTHTKTAVKFDFRPDGGRCQGSNAAYFLPCLFHPMVSPAALNACIGPGCASTMAAKAQEMYAKSTSVVRFDQPAGTKEAVVRTNVGLGQHDVDKRKVQVAAALFSTNPQRSHCPASAWTHRELMGGGSLSASADFTDYYRVFATDPAAGFAGREYVENYPHSFVMDTDVNLVSTLESEIVSAVKQKKPEANSVGASVTILDPRSFSVFTTLVLDRDAVFSATKYIQTRTDYQIVHHGTTIQVGVFGRTWAWQTSSNVLWFVADALSDGAADMARDVAAEVSATLAARFAESLPAGAGGGVVAAEKTTLVLGEDGQVFALVAL